jgi:hypothetical protein
MSGFDAQWLARREPFDAQARDPALAGAFAASLRAPPDGVRRIIDLAAGTGANFRWLAPHLGGDQEWRLVDHDPLLRAVQATAIGRWAAAAGWSFRTFADAVEVRAGEVRWLARAHAFDLTEPLGALGLARFDGVTTAAFLDLVSADWLGKLADSLACAARPLLAVLTVDGRREWSPPLAADQTVHSAFQRHQGADKGFGSALGDAATAALGRLLVARGFDVRIAASDWRIAAPHPEMLGQMLVEACAVACEAAPEQAPAVQRWRAVREAQLEAGELALTVGHSDLLALPPEASDGARGTLPV